MGRIENLTTQIQNSNLEIVYNNDEIPFTLEPNLWQILFAAVDDNAESMLYYTLHNEISQINDVKEIKFLNPNFESNIKYVNLKFDTPISMIDALYEVEIYYSQPWSFNPDKDDPTQFPYDINTFIRHKLTFGDTITNYRLTGFIPLGNGVYKLIQS